LKNRQKIVKIPPPPLNHPLRISIADKKERIEQAKLAIGNAYFYKFFRIF
jgi:hypothetical protein